MASRRDLPHVLAAVHPRTRVPHRLAGGGLVGCLVLAFSLPLPSVLAGAALLALGAAVFRLRRRSAHPESRAGAPGAQGQDGAERA